MEIFQNKEVDLKEYSPLTLAFVGDGVYDLFVREHIVTKENAPVKKLHESAVKMVKCEFQAKICKELLVDIMTEEEKSAYTRGRNAKVNSIPKNAKHSDYHAATGFESMFGYLYLKGETDRLKYFFKLICEFYDKYQEENN